MSFWRRISPRRAVEDFAGEWRQPTPYRWQILGLAVAGTFAMMILFIPKSERIEPRHPDVTFIASWRADRGDDEIVASNIENQKRKDAVAAIEQQRVELRKDMYRALGQASGLDTDKMEADIAREEASEQAAKPPGDTAAAPAQAKPSTETAGGE